MEIKPIGWKPDGTHVHKGALALIICIVIGCYCMGSDAPFGMPKTKDCVGKSCPMPKEK